MNKQETIKLGWQLIEHKLRYYIFNDPIIEDLQYDAMERVYIDGCKEHEIEDTISTMPGIDIHRPSVVLVLDKLQGRGYTGTYSKNK